MRFLGALNLIDFFRISNQKECVVREMGKWGEEGWRWEFKWTRNLLPRDLSLLNQFLNHLSKFQLHKDKQDSWVWKRRHIIY